MFNNIGGKIMTLAKVLCWIGIISSIIGGIAFIVAGSSGARIVDYVSNQSGYSSTPIASVTGGAAVVSGILIMVFGSLLSWITSFVTYGFGQLVSDTERIRKKTEGTI